jgi:hypothetical protein
MTIVARARRSRQGHQTNAVPRYFDRLVELALAAEWDDGR